MPFRVSSDQLRQALPVPTGTTKTISPDQDVKEIMREVLQAHEVFAGDYDRIAKFFNVRTTCRIICEDLFDFCKQNIRYDIETKTKQTSRSPGVLLVMGKGDCKHYAGFIGGVLAALNRQGRNFDWCYRFASYDLLDSEPKHVFIVVNSSGAEYWIDPVLATFDQRYPQPWYYIDKRPKMALQRISGIGMGATGLPTDPISIISTALQFVSAFGKDEVPNYPIKSGNTFEKLKGIVQSKVQPMPPRNLAEANTALAAAKSALAAEQGGSGAANETIKMMYGEVITALTNYINSNGTVAVQTPYGGVQNITPVIDPRLAAGPASQASISPLMLAGLAGAVLYMANKKPRSVHGPGNFMLPLLIAGGVYLFIQSQTAGKEKAALLETASPGEKVIYESMSKDEIHDVYVYLNDYLKLNKLDVVPADLSARIQVIKTKYNLFS